MQQDNNWNAFETVMSVIDREWVHLNKQMERLQRELSPQRYRYRQNRAIILKERKEPQLVAAMEKKTIIFLFVIIWQVHVFWTLLIPKWKQIIFEELELITEKESFLKNLKISVLSSIFVIFRLFFRT